MDWRGGRVLALKENLRSDQDCSAPSAGGDRRTRAIKRFLVAQAEKNSSNKQCNSLAGWPRPSTLQSRCCTSWLSRPPCTPTWFVWKKMSISYSNRNRSLGQICAGKKENSNGSGPRQVRSSARDCDRSSLRRNARGQLRFDRDRHITGAGTASPLHHGRSDSQH